MNNVHLINMNIVHNRDACAMRTDLTFIALVFGYCGIFALGAGITAVADLNENGLAAIAFTAAFFTSICFYIPTAVSYLFYKVTRKRRWLNATLGAVFIAGFHSFWIISDRLAGGGAGTDGFKYLAGGIAGAILLFLTFIGILCASRKHGRFTRNLGYIVFAGVAHATFIIIAEFNDLIDVKLDDILFLGPLGITVGAAALGLLSVAIKNIRPQNPHQEQVDNPHSRTASGESLASIKLSADR